MVAMESCEFCWTATKLFKAIGVQCQVLNFDAIEYAPGNKGNVIRSSLQARPSLGPSRLPTVPARGADAT